MGIEPRIMVFRGEHNNYNTNDRNDILPKTVNRKRYFIFTLNKNIPHLLGV